MSEDRFVVGGRGSRFGEFVRRGLTRSQQEALDAALEEEGLEHEVAMLRLKLVAVMRKKSLDLKAVDTIGGALMRAVGTQYRMSPKSKKKLADGLAFVLGNIGDHVLPPDR